MTKFKILLIFIVITSYIFCVGCKHENYNKENPQESEIIKTDEEVFLEFKQAILIKNKPFILEKEYFGGVNYQTKIYYDCKSVYIITTTTTQTHKLYTNDFVYTNNINNSIQATKTITTLKDEILSDIFLTKWAFSDKIIGESSLFDSCIMQINKDESNIIFTFENYENELLENKVVCTLTISENLDIKEIIIPQLKVAL